jgi:hypothetical protein
MKSKASKSATKRWANMSTRKYNAICAAMSKSQKARWRKARR